MLIRKQQASAIAQNLDFSKIIQRLNLFDFTTEKFSFIEQNATKDKVKNASCASDLIQAINELLDKNQFPTILIINECIRKLGDFCLSDYALELFDVVVNHGRADILSCLGALDAIAKMDLPDMEKMNQVFDYAEKNRITFPVIQKMQNNQFDLHGLSFGTAYFWLKEILEKAYDQDMAFTLVYGKGSHSTQTPEKKHPLKKAVEKAISDVRNNGIIKIIYAQEDQENPGRFTIVWQCKQHSDLDPTLETKQETSATIKNNGLLETIYCLEQFKPGTIRDTGSEIPYRRELKETSNKDELNAVLLIMMQEGIVPGPRTLHQCKNKLERWNEPGLADDIAGIITKTKHPATKSSRVDFPVLPKPPKRGAPATTAPHAALFQSRCLPKAPSVIARAQGAASSANRTLSWRRAD